MHFHNKSLLTSRINFRHCLSVEFVSLFLLSSKCVFENRLSNVYSKLWFLFLCFFFVFHFVYLCLDTYLFVFNWAYLH